LRIEKTDRPTRKFAIAHRVADTRNETPESDGKWSEMVVAVELGAIAIALRPSTDDLEPVSALHNPPI
jgi:hypothetical protein